MGHGLTLYFRTFRGFVGEAEQDNTIEIAPGRGSPRGQPIENGFSRMVEQSYLF